MVFIDGSVSAKLRSEWWCGVEEMWITVGMKMGAKHSFNLCVTYLPPDDDNALLMFSNNLM